MINPDTLQTLEVFSDLEEEDLKQVARIVIEKDVPAGQALFMEQVKGETLFIVLDGAVQVQRKTASGEDLPLYRAEAGEFLGAFSIFDPGDRPVSAQTVEPSKVLIVRRKDLLKLAEKAPSAAFHFVLHLAQNSLAKARALTDLQKEDLDQAGALLKKA
ncbi:MAG: Crp/Fnr family transcriptional regulator [Bdellovibrionota bacterium]